MIIFAATLLVQNLQYEPTEQAYNAKPHPQVIRFTNIYYYALSTDNKPGRNSTSTSSVCLPFLF